MKIKELYLFTNRNLLAYNEGGEQVTLPADCYEIGDSEKLLEVINDARIFYLARWSEWRHEITKEEFIYLMGLGKSLKEKCHEEK